MVLDPWIVLNLLIKKLTQTISKKACIREFQTV